MLLLPGRAGPTRTLPFMMCAVAGPDCRAAPAPGPRSARRTNCPSASWSKRGATRADVRERDRVVEPELQAVPEPAVERELDRVERPPALVEAAGAGHRAVAAIGAHQIGIRRGVGRRARRGARRERRILGRRQERRPVVDRVDVPRSAGRSSCAGRHRTRPATSPREATSARRR